MTIEEKKWTYLAHRWKANQRHSSIARLLYVESSTSWTRFWGGFEELGAVSGEFGFKKAKMILSCLLACHSITIAHDRKCPGIFTLFFWATQREVSCEGSVVIYPLNLLRAISATSPHLMVSECMVGENGTYPRFLLSTWNLDFRVMLYTGHTFSTIPMVVKCQRVESWVCW